MKKAILAAAVMGMILLFPQAAVEGARNAMTVWYRSVAPVLFPFFVLMPLVTSAEACAVYERLFSKIMGRMFKLPGAAAPAMLISIVAGSPAGAIAIARIAAAGKLKSNEARRMAMALCGLSPSFLILGIGQGMYGSAELGWRLAGIQLAVQMGILLLTRGMGPGEEKSIATEFGYASGMGTAIENILAVCGYMVLFGTISSVAGCIAGKKIGNFALLLMDLPGGSAELAGMEIKGKLTLQCAAIGFGGLCIAFQNMDVLKKAGVSWRYYLIGRGLAAMLFAGIGGRVLASGRYGAAGIRTALNANSYAFALLFACIAALPWIYSLGKDIFLNKRKN